MKVRVIAEVGALRIVQWYDNGSNGPIYYRSRLPTDVVPGRVGDVVDVANPEWGIDEGEPWDELLIAEGVARPIAERIANELRRNGIWTVFDLEQRPADAVAAFQSGYGMGVQRLRLMAKARIVA